MNLNRLEESPTTLMESLSTPLSSAEENQQQTLSQLEHTMRPPIQLPISPTGESESLQTLTYSEPHSHQQSVTNSVITSSSLKSNAKPHVIQEKLAVEPRVLRVSKTDIAAFCQVVAEFQDQFLS